MNLKKILIIVFATTIMLLTACQKEDNTLTIGIMPDIDSIPLVVAKQQGYFGDNVTLEIYKSAADRDSAFHSGNLDGCISDILAASLAKEGDFPVYITSKTNGRYGIVTTKDSGITSANMLEGKAVGLSLNTLMEYVTDEIVRADGGDPSAINKTSVPQIPSRLELLQNSQLDAAALPEPFITAALKDGDIIIGSTDELGINPGVFLYSAKAVDNKTNEIESFYEAYNKAVDYINSTDSSEFMPKVIEEVGLPESALSIELPEYEKASLPNESDINEVVNWLVSKQLIKNAYTYDDLVKDIISK